MVSLFPIFKNKIYSLINIKLNLFLSECTGENEIYMSCGTACPTTCLNRMLIRPCILMCKQGCFCKEGFVRIGVDGAGGNGRCIEESKCDETIRDMTRHD